MDCTISGGPFCYGLERVDNSLKGSQYGNEYDNWFEDE